MLSKPNTPDCAICADNPDRQNNSLSLKISFRNARRQAKDYLVYFVTIVMAAALIYSFNGLVFSKELLELSVRMEYLPAMIVFASVVVVCIIGWLVNYTTGFMLSRRSRELGTYMLIGLEPKQVTGLFMKENLIIGIAAFVPGTLMGSLLFQALRAILLTLFGISYHFRLSFSPKAGGLTLVYFVLIYLFAQLKCRKRIRSMKIHDLIYYEKVNEEEVIQKSSRRRRIFVISIVFGIMGTLLLMAGSTIPSFAGAACIIVFLYGFFISFSSGVPAWFESRPEKKYRRQTLLVFRTLSAKLASMGIVMATISLLFTAVLISLGLGILFSRMFDFRAQQSCFDLFISDTDTGVGFKEQAGSGREIESPDANAAGKFQEYADYVHRNLSVADELQYPLYLSKDDTLTDYLEANTRFSSFYGTDMVMRYSDYAALRAMLGYPQAVMEPGQYLIHCMPYLKKGIEEYPLSEEYDKSVTYAKEGLTPGNVYTEIFHQYLWGGNGYNYILILPDDAAEKYAMHSICYAVMTREPVSEEQYYDLRDIFYRTGTRHDGIFDGDSYGTIDAKSQAQRAEASEVAMFVLPLYYLALILSMTTVTILTIHQLSEMNRYRQQFTLLRKLGMEPREMIKALRTQLAVYYAMPAVPPLFITVPLILNFENIVEPEIMMGTGGALMILAVTLGLFAAIYAVYILSAYSGLKRNVLPEHLICPDRR